MANYPILSKDFDATSFQESSENAVVAGGQTEGGYIYTRARFTRRPRKTFTFKHVDLSETERITLATFWDDHFGGAAAFNWTHPVTSVVYNVRFDPEMTLDFERIGFGTNHRWDTSTITIKEI